MTIEEIRKNAPKDAEMYRIKGDKVLYYNYNRNYGSWFLQRWDGDGWGFTRVFKYSEIKPLYP